MFLVTLIKSIKLYSVQGNKLFDNYNYDQKGDRTLREKSHAHDHSLPLLSETSNHRREKLRRASIVDGLARANVGITEKRDEKLWYTSAWYLCEERDDDGCRVDMGGEKQTSQTCKTEKK